MYMYFMYFSFSLDNIPYTVLCMHMYTCMYITRMLVHVYMHVYHKNAGSWCGRVNGVCILNSKPVLWNLT